MAANQGIDIDPDLRMPLASRRTPQACVPCRHRKRKCGGQPGTACNPCIERGTNCVYLEGRRSTSSPPPPSPESTPPSTPSPEQMHTFIQQNTLDPLTILTQHSPSHYHHISSAQPVQAPAGGGQYLHGTNVLALPQADAGGHRSYHADHRPAIESNGQYAFQHPLNPLYSPTYPQQQPSIYSPPQTPDWSVYPSNPGYVPQASDGAGSTYPSNGPYAMPYRTNGTVAPQGGDFFGLGALSPPFHSNNAPGPSTYAFPPAVGAEAARENLHGRQLQYEASDEDGENDDSAPPTSGSTY